MKRIFLMTPLMVLPLLLQGQSIFEKYQNNNQVNEINIDSKIFQLLGNMTVSSADNDAAAMIEMIKGIKSFKALITRKKLICNEIDAWVWDEVDEKGFDLIASMKEFNKELNIFIKEGKIEGELQSLIMFSKGFSNTFPEVKVDDNQLETLLLIIEGKIELSKIAQLISKMNLPGGDQLKMLKI